MLIDETQVLLHSTESYRVEKTISIGNMDKFSETLYAFVNDLPNSHKKEHMLIGASDDLRLRVLMIGSKRLQPFVLMEISSHSLWCQLIKLDSQNQK